ncbi:hypothetical protein BKA00_001398 [Actinomadura coerulea]|uniref:Uncharacterized protein n=1 Tax=Actinomadura coerulea TaxID=46159 RepID=A0A7X0FVT7_9ACTN|nr:hypothetical protein [Actinomadura coerulea]MBB6394484.1 hypothetical protein [Actinomadura coerulea]GGQ29081.1 hypothetical protein GCM10010187_52140 [Actinomadura coerulea]
MVDGGPTGAGTRPPAEGATGPAARDRERGRRARKAALRELAEALVIAAVSPALPGIAHLRSGRVRLGAALLTVQALALTAAALAAGYGRPLLLEAAARPAWPAAMAAGCVVVAALWAGLIVHSYAVLLPAGLAPLWRLAGGTTVSVLCLLVIVPPLSAAHALAPCPLRDHPYGPPDGGGFTILTICTKGHTRSHAIDSYATFARFDASIM